MCCWFSYMVVYVLEREHVNIPNATISVPYHTNWLAAMKFIPVMVHAWLAGLKHVFEKATHQSRKDLAYISWCWTSGVKCLLFLEFSLSNYSNFVPINLSWLREISTYTLLTLWNGWADKACTDCLGMDILPECCLVHDYGSHLI